MKNGIGEKRVTFINFSGARKAKQTEKVHQMGAPISLTVYVKAKFLIAMRNP